MTSAELLRGWLEVRLAPPARAWMRTAAAEIAAGAADARFCALLSLASRHARRAPLAPGAAEIAAAGRALAGWNPERWNLLEALRAALVLARADLESDGTVRALGEAFRHADEGELCALLRVLALLPGAERFAWRAGEGCRSNMRTVFEAAALDTPFPARWFDDVAWRQCAVKCVFVGAPLWRLWGLDGRLSSELARMALDLADERRSAGRPVPHELWLCLGKYGGARGVESLARELDPANANVPGRRAAVLALARAGETARLAACERTEKDPAVVATLARARAGEHDATAWRLLAPQA